MTTSVVGAKVTEAITAGSLGILNAGAAFTVAQASQILSESTLVPVGLAITVLTISVGFTYKITRWMAAKEQRENENQHILDDMQEEIDKLKKTVKKKDP